MRIGIDYRPVYRPNSRHRGIGKYTASQIDAILACGGHDYVLYTIGEQRPTLPGTPCWRQLPSLRRPGRLNWLLDRFHLHHWISRDGLDAYHATEVTALPTRSPCPVVLTVHDVIPLVYWEEMKLSMPVDYRFGLRDAYRRAARAARIVTISDSARHDICRHMGIDEHNIEVVYPGCDPRFRPRPPAESRRALAGYEVRRPFVFYVGGSDFRKNLPVLIRGFARVREQGYDGSLVLAGETFVKAIPETEKLRNQIRQLGLEDSVCCPGYVHDDHLPDFYSACDLFVFPSLYEGFGLPVLEALGCGAAVVASDRSSIPEVGGETVQYFDPECEEALAGAVLAVLESPSRLDQMRASGPGRAALFSWEKHARSMRSVYESLK